MSKIVILKKWCSIGVENLKNVRQSCFNQQFLRKMILDRRKIFRGVTDNIFIDLVMVNIVFFTSVANKVSGFLEEKLLFYLL